MRMTSNVIQVFRNGKENKKQFRNNYQTQCHKRQFLYSTNVGYHLNVGTPKLTAGLVNSRQAALSVPMHTRCRAHGTYRCGCLQQGLMSHPLMGGSLPLLFPSFLLVCITLAGPQMGTTTNRKIRSLLLLLSCK